MSDLSVLHDMTLFVEVARTANFSRASGNLGVPAATLSRRISAMERRLGARLFERTTRKVELTDAGRRYFERCGELVDQARLAQGRCRTRHSCSTRSTQRNSERSGPVVLPRVYRTVLRGVPGAALSKPPGLHALSVLAFASRRLTSNNSRPRRPGSSRCKVCNAAPMGQAAISDIWQATRASIDSAFGAPVNVAALSSTATEGRVVLSSDGLRAIFSSDRPGGVGNADLWTASRPDVSSPFSEPRNLPRLNTGADEQDVALSSDERELLFASSRGGVSSLWRSVLDCP